MKHKKKEYRIKIEISNNERRYFPQIYEGFFCGWCYYTNFPGLSDKYFKTITESIDFITDRQNEEIKETKFIRV
jgi:uncharacterized protein (DUF2225 family)